MGSWLSVLQVVVRRVRANGRLLLAVVVGAVLASALMSTTSIYTDAIRDLGLDYAIRQSGPDRTNIIVSSNSQGSAEETYLSNGQYIEDTAKQTIGALIDGAITRVGRSSTFYPSAPGERAPTADNRPRSHLQFVTDIEKHVTVRDGRLPGDASFSQGEAPSIEVAVGGETARRQNIRVGDRFALHPFWDTSAAPLLATVAGIIEPVDAAEAFWVGQSDLFYYPSANWATLAFFISQETFFKAVAAYLPGMISDYKSLIYLDPAPINARNAATVRLSLLSLDSLLGQNVPRTSAKTDLADVLQSFDEKLFFTRIPLLVLVLQIAGIVLYYLFMVSTMLVERQTSEIALLKSRGATTAQVMQIYAIEGLVILAIGLALGPPLAATVIGLLGHTPMFSDLSNGEALSVRLSSGAYLWAAGGALLAYAALLFPAYQATRRTVVQQRTASARPPQQAAFTRYYLDLVLVGIAAVLFYQLNRRSDLVTDKLFGEQSVDPILLLTPTFFTLTVGIVFLRLFPLALRILSWLVGKAQGTTMLIGMWQLVRNPVHYSRLVLLLMLATAVGMFAASFGTTLNRSYEERAAYESGAALRLRDLRRSEAAGPLTLGATVATATGAEASSGVMRLSGSHGPLLSRTSFDIIGIDPATFADVAYFRGDFAGTSLETIVDRLAQDAPERELALPPDARWLGVWYNPVEVRGRVALEAEARDSTGRYFIFTFGPDAGYELAPGWVFLAADLTRPLAVPASPLFVAGPPQSPLTLTTISLRFITRVSALNGSFLIDDLQASGTVPDALAATRMQADPGRTLPDLPGARIVAGFDSVSEWAPAQGILNDPLKDDVQTVPSGKGGTALELRWQPVQGQPQTHGLKPRRDDRPLAVFASEAFLEQGKLGVGARTTAFLNGSYVPMEVVGSFRLFPTLGDPRRTASVIANGARLEALMNARPGPPAYYADEVWLKAAPEALGPARQALAEGKLAATLVSFSELRTAQQKDPLVAAGWEGILFISFAAILILSAIGFLIYSYLTAQRRTLEFAVLRTMGFSKRQIAGVVAFEQLFVIGLGMLAGTLMGMRLGRLMIRYMGVTETGDEVLPPMALHVSWLTVGSAWLVLALVFLVTIGIVVLLYSRLALHRVLRIGEA